MQDYIDLAEKNGITLVDKGKCQCCGANTTRGIHECVELFSLGFEYLNYADPAHFIYRFLSVDAHTLQHPEIHGRWNNHFHLTRLHLIFYYKVAWNYQLSPQLSNCLNKYKIDRQNEYLIPPEVTKRGTLTTTAIIEQSTSEETCKSLVKAWAMEVYQQWNKYHSTIDPIAQNFLKQ